MKTAVFDGEKRLHGWLEHDDRLAAGNCRQFEVWCRPDPISIPLKPSAQITASRDGAIFTWAILCAARSVAGIWEARVLITSHVEKLGRVPGFKWFAEECGIYRPMIGAPVTDDPLTDHSPLVKQI